MDEKTLEDQLLEALKREEPNPSEVKYFADQLLVTKDNKLNLVEANNFQKFSRCRIYPQESDIYHFRSFVGVIEYNGYYYSFG